MWVRISPTSPHRCLAVSYAAKGSQNQLTSPTPSCIALQQVSQLWCASALGVRQMGFAHACPIMLSITLVINPRCACAAKVRSVSPSVRPSVRPSVCLSVTTFSATTRNKAAKKRYQRVQYHTGLSDFRKSTAFKSYGLKTKRTSQLLMSMAYLDQILPVSEHGGGSARKMKGEYVVLVWQKHYLPT